LVKGDIVEAQDLPDPVHSRMLHRLASKFVGVQIHYFFHPEVLGIGEQAAANVTPLVSRKKAQ
jgi:hypothetical protein